MVLSGPVSRRGVKGGRSPTFYTTLTDSTSCRIVILDVIRLYYTGIPFQWAGCPGLWAGRPGLWAGLLTRPLRRPLVFCPRTIRDLRSTAWDGRETATQHRETAPQHRETAPQHGLRLLHSPTRSLFTLSVFNLFSAPSPNPAAPAGCGGFHT